MRCIRRHLALLLDLTCEYLPARTRTLRSILSNKIFRLSKEMKLDRNRATFPQTASVEKLILLDSGISRTVNSSNFL